MHFRRPFHFISPLRRHQRGVPGVGSIEDSILKMGDEATAKDPLVQAALPCVPRWLVVVWTAEDARNLLYHTGLLVMLKSTVGRGLRDIYQNDSLKQRSTVGV